MAEGRPNPEELLARIKAEEEHAKKGKLTIFLGYAAGVGKTYAMLEAAQQRKKEVDLVVAVVETHGRAETEALLKNLEIIPRKQVEYRSIRLSEMDIDAVLARRPQLALVDELAHTNATGSRHPKRYQDVEELLDAGIDVYTTLNAQHVESARDKVAQVTSTWVRETIPDTIIDRAAEIKLVDLLPDDLIQRLKEGKVYVPEQILHATAEFFRKGNLTALREVTMRLAAEHVDKQMRVYMRTHAVPGPWQATERLLVCISPSPLGNRLIRNARILASQLNAEWFAVYVETPGSILSSVQQDRLANTLRFAERMGSKVRTLQGHSVTDAILKYAETHDISKIIVGKPQRNRWQELFRTSTVDNIIRRSKHIDVYIVTGAAESIKKDETPTRQLHFHWWGYLIGLGLVIGATLLGSLMHAFFDPTNIVMLYLLSVVIAAVYFGLGPSILVSILSVLAFDFFFVPPTLTFAIADVQYLFTFITLLGVGIVVSYLTARVRRQTEAARRRAMATATLYTLSRDMAVTPGLEATVNAIVNHVEETMGLTTMIFLPNIKEEGKLKLYARKRNLTIDENDFAVASWVFQHQQTAGHGTDTLPDTRARYFPLNTTRGAVGVMAIWMADTNQQLTMEQVPLLEAFADLAAIGIERAEKDKGIRDTAV